MLTDYILGAEIANKGNFHMANISQLFKTLDLVEGTDYLKFGGITVLSKLSLKYPKYIKKLIDSEEMTSLEGLMPYTHFSDMFKNRLKKLRDEYDDVVINKKKFVRFKDKDFYNILTSIEYTKIVVERDELKELKMRGMVKGYKNLTVSKTLIWY